MTSKEALERIKLHKYIKCKECDETMLKGCRCCNNELKNSEEFETIEKDLEELEELKEVISILRWCIDIVKNDNGEYMILPEGNTSEEEYNLIKKFLM